MPISKKLGAIAGCVILAALAMMSTNNATQAQRGQPRETVTIEFSDSTRKASANLPNSRIKDFASFDFAEGGSKVTITVTDCDSDKLTAVLDAVRDCDVRLVTIKPPPKAGVDQRHPLTLSGPVKFKLAVSGPIKFKNDGEAKNKADEIYGALSNLPALLGKTRADFKVDKQGIKTPIPDNIIKQMAGAQLESSLDELGSQIKQITVELGDQKNVLVIKGPAFDQRLRNLVISAANSILAKTSKDSKTWFREER